MKNSERTSILVGRLEELRKQVQQHEDKNGHLLREKEAIENEIRQLQSEARDRNVVTKIAREYEEKLEKLKESMQKAVRN
jgi:cell division protein FtsB